ncbi:uncharacterized protein AMSG_08461 [Thecamonas trahens ATCC 50062]|uniref:Uncharacterized protein n=1 Tax=Thecamonas trahens ATCC 50062 TaxID=461836 RepID=A0A0L0DMI9_THETB|nr:hypothetical protein AMSG_08461 [Thecamonas trahens ATCC 50062]KNC52598.1 hypothetical protein AMSG_08461 [Thecamonas trahens ATCC 50062]|eukprot:XP_013755157.1 hypothetical protein AMSG_08461 [Thecamonas trahens ATCC 50062]
MTCATETFDTDGSVTLSYRHCGAEDGSSTSFWLFQLIMSLLGALAAAFVFQVGVSRRAVR